MSTRLAKLALMFGNFVIGVAILVSGLVSVSLTPMLCSRFLKPPHEQRHGAFYNITERMFNAWVRLYDVTLRITRKDGSVIDQPVKLRIDTPIEVDYYRHGGILPFVLRQLLS